MDTNKEFLRLYNELEGLLADHYDCHDRSRSLITRYLNELSRSGRSASIRRGELLNDARVIRNALVHELDMNAEGFLSIDQRLLIFLESEIKRLRRPKTALEVATPMEHIFYVKPEDLVRTKVPVMIARGNMQAPVLDERGHVIGCLSPNALMRYLSEKPTPDHDLRVDDLLEYVRLDRHVSEYYQFASRSTLAEEVAASFDGYYRRGKKLVAVFVTEHGSKAEALLGIITPYDVMNIDDR